ncbi:MAG: serine/threonine protein kinase [Polyangiaceae bacterium]|nr:serine/threonine protein kinase [Polyangiaceae bacterium]MCW5791576.1 serine/threonine protein kinase [Polyangiaceae bacterium]
MSGEGQLGQRIAGRYELCEVLARGGMSLVYRAVDHRTQREVAIKLLHEGLADRADLNVRMVREYRAMRLLEGSAAVEVLELAVGASGALCLVMELLRGVDFDDYLTSAQDEHGQLPVQDVLDLLDPVVATLERGHEAGIIHRDLKPGNLFVLSESADRSGTFNVSGSAGSPRSGWGARVRLLDFGFCRAGLRSITPDGTVLGSPSYIPPEVWRGHASQTSAACDIYSLGAIVFRLLGGRVPFDAERLTEKLALVCSSPRPSLWALRPELPPEVDEWVAQVLAVSPDARFRKVRGMWEALQSVLGCAPRTPRRQGRAPLRDCSWGGEER